MATTEKARPADKQKVLSTKEIANRLAELCRKGQFNDAHKELYAQNAESIEPDKASQQGWTPKIKGLDKIAAKAVQWESMVQDFHGITVSEPLVAGNFIALAFSMDVTMKGAPRKKSDELGIYEVQDGKIISEQFIY